MPKPRFNWCSQECIDLHGQATTRSYWAHTVYKRDRGICQVCGVEIKTLSDIPTGGFYRHPVRPWAADHIIPIAVGGPNTLENQRLLCVPCHKDVTATWHREKAEARRQEKRASHGAVPGDQIPMGILT